MNDSISLKVTSTELSTLAGLVGYDYLVGVGSLKNDLNSSLRTQRIIRSTVKRLERKHFIRVGMEGLLLIDKNVAEVLRMIYKPRRIVRVNRGASELTYLSDDNKKFMTIKTASDNSFRFLVSDTLNLKPLTKTKTNRTAEFSLPKSVVEKAKKSLETFEEASAHLTLKEQLHSADNADFLINLIKGDGVITKLEFVNCSDKMYSSERILFIAEYNNIATIITSDENMIKILPFDRIKLEEKIENYLCFKEV